MAGRNNEKELCAAEIASDIPSFMKKHIYVDSWHNLTRHQIQQYSNTPHLFEEYSNKNNTYTGDKFDNVYQKLFLQTQRCEQTSIERYDYQSKTFSIVLASSDQKHWFQILKPNNYGLVSLIIETKYRFQT